MASDFAPQTSLTRFPRIPLIHACTTTSSSSFGGGVAAVGMETADREMLFVLHKLTGWEVLGDMAGGEMLAPRPPSRAGRR
jgi:hypothetical protein